MFAEITETHQQGQEQGQGQRHGDCGNRSVEKQLRYNLEFQSFADQIIHIKPHELHHPDEHHNKKGEDEGSQKRFGDIAVEFLHF